jgi:hypothetical protein
MKKNLKAFFRLVFGMVIITLISSFVSASDGEIYVQPFQSDLGGFFSNIGNSSTCGQVAADNFTLWENNSEVTGIKWYGFYQKEFTDPIPIPNSLEFYIGFYSDDEGKPGIKIYGQTLPATVTETGEKVTNGPNDGKKIYEFKVEFSSTLIFMAGETNWLSISDNDITTPFDSLGQWLWNYSPATTTDTKAFACKNQAEPFSELWQISSQFGQLAFSLLGSFPEPISVSIDIKPGSDPNCFNQNGHGVIPVAILGGADFFVEEINTETLSFAGLNVRIRGNAKPMCSIENVNMDEYPDLVCHFEDISENWVIGNEESATLTGDLFDGSSFIGADTICVVP